MDFELVPKEGTTFLLISVEEMLNGVTSLYFNKWHCWGALYFSLAFFFLIQPHSFFLNLIDKFGVNIVCKGSQLPSTFKVPTPLSNMPLPFKIFCFPTPFFISSSLKTFYTVPPPTLQQSIHQPHPTCQPILNHHIQDIYFQQMTTIF